MTPGVSPMSLEKMASICAYTSRSIRPTFPEDRGLASIVECELIRPSVRHACHAAFLRYLPLQPQPVRRL